MKVSLNSVLFLGVGGISMYQLALAYKNMGYNVLGYDAKKSKYTKLLEENGIKICYRFNKEFLYVKKCIKTAAIKDDNKYVVALKKLNVKIVDRAVALGELCTKFKCVVAVAGTHGKSTTASLIYEILKAKFKKVSCHIGADVFNPRFNPGDDFLVVEACEYNKSFLHLKPNIAVVTNVEPDHMDCYKTMFNLRSAFLTFAKRAQLRFCGDDKTTYFLKKLNDMQVVQPTELNIKPKILGEHNFKNISMAVAVAKSLNVDEKTIINAINSFQGINRRYEFLGEYLNQKIYIDYAHHPTEIKAFVSTFSKQYPSSLIIFQPHTYSRTKYLLNEFLSVLSNIKNLCIYKEYPAREKKNMGLSAHELYLLLKEKNEGVKYLASVSAVIKQAKDYDAIAFVGAGDIDKVAVKIIKFAKNC